MAGDAQKEKEKERTSFNMIGSKPKAPKTAHDDPSKIVLAKPCQLTEERYGTFYDKDGKPHEIKRFTWKNHNKIQVQVINYGARITSMKMPNRNGDQADVLLGFDDLAGYIYYGNYYIGAIIGRTAGRIYNGTYVFEGKQTWLSQNDGEHHRNGGRVGFDKVVWTPYVNGNQLMLSYVSPDGEEGYPGDLFVRIFFELTVQCEFKIRIEANCAKITPIDITNQLYFNLAGHEKGEDELNKHILLLNSNCYTPYKPDGFPSGEIQNTIHTHYDFQTPKTLEKMFGPENEGYDQCFCVNRGVDQGNAFIGRLSHPSSGRILEIYSNQYAVNVYTADCFGRGLIEIPGLVITPSPSLSSNVLRANDGVFMFVKKMHEYLSMNLELPESDYIEMLKGITKKLIYLGASQEGEGDKFLEDQGEWKVTEQSDFQYSTLFQPLELEFLLTLKKAVPFLTSDMDFLEMRNMVDDLLQEQLRLDDGTTSFDPQHDEFLSQMFKRQYEIVEKRNAEQHAVAKTTESATRSSLTKSNAIIKPTNVIPEHYKDGRLHGKTGVIYRKQGAICLQTQNYPNALYHTRFPSPIVKPPDTYVHTITYKFWVQSGNPKRWLKRMDMDKNSTCVMNKI